MILLVLSIDAECDKDQNWNVKRPMSFTNIISGIPQRLTPLFGKYKIKPTYLISPEVLNDEDSVSLLKSMKNCELGTHLHCEFIDPDANFNSITTLRTQNTLTYEIEYKKISNLTDLFKKRFNYSPLSFRAGRFGISNNTLKILSKLGYRIDSSVVPFRNQEYNSVKQSFFGAPLKPYYPSTDNYNRKGNSNILEVPVSHFIDGFEYWPPFILRQLPRYNNLFLRILKRFGKKVEKTWIRPNRLDSIELSDATKKMIKTYFRKEENIIINIMFHSNEIMEGCSPYCSDTNDVDNYINSLDKYFDDLFTNYQIHPISLSESIEFFQ